LTIGRLDFSPLYKLLRHIFCFKIGDIDVPLFDMNAIFTAEVQSYSQNTVAELMASWWGKNEYKDILENFLYWDSSLNLQLPRWSIGELQAEFNRKAY
jgi:hypothetical protein